MEMIAVIQGLEALKEPCRVAVVTDSQYVIGGITGKPSFCVGDR